MKYWIVPSNDSTFRIGDAIKAQGGMADWRTKKFSVGDIVFIYKSNPEQCIRYKMEVVKTDLFFDQAFDQEKFWTDQETFYNGITSVYARLKLLDEYPDDRLSLAKLHEHGIRGNIQSVQSCPEESIGFLLNSTEEEDNFKPDIETSVDDDDFFEGTESRVTTNRYERNRDARKKCIELKGLKCLVCGCDFEGTYGEIGKGFIHVHHLVPISSIGKKYQLNIEQDLAPVCPNCHYMLHRKDPPYSIDELKKMLDEAESKSIPVAARNIEIYPLPKYFDGCVPLYNLRAACGSFEENEIPEVEGWFDARGHGFTPDPERHFAVYAKGNSMYPKICDGDICIFEKYQGGSRNGEIVLTQRNGKDPDTGCDYTIKKYSSKKIEADEGWQQESITLSPINPNYEDIQLDPDKTYLTIGIFKCTLNNH